MKPKNAPLAAGSPTPRTPLVLTAASAITASASATGALFGLQSHADASIVYVNPNIVVTAPNSGYFGTPFKIGVGSFFARVHKNTYMGIASAGRASIFPGSKNQWLHAPTSGYFIGKLAAHAMIGPLAGSWNNPVTDTGGVLRLATVGGFQRGQWTTGKSGFAGVRIALGGSDFDYGWIRMEFDDADADGVPETLHVVDFAYENTPNTAIAAGDEGVPEPGTAALLALAAGGAAFLRRKREPAGNS